MMDISKKRGGWILVHVLLLGLFLAPLAEAVAVHDVVGLVQSGIDDDTIMAIVKKTGAAFSLSEEERQQLRGAGASERLITFLSNPSAGPPPPAHTRPPVKTERSPCPSSEKPVAPSARPSLTQLQNLTAGLGQERTQSQKEPWQGGRQGKESQPTGQSLTSQSQGGVPHPQVMEILPLQLSEEGRHTQPAISSREQTEKETQPSSAREAIVTITVTDREKAYITDLGKEELRLYEDGIPREIVALVSDQHTPVSIGILLDTSGSMTDKLDEVEDGLRHFVNTLQPEDEVFLLAFNDTPRLVQDFTSNSGSLARVLSPLWAKGATALYDVIAAGLTKIQEGRHRKKALLLITDGNDTTSTLSLAQVMELARRADVLIYSLGIRHEDRGLFGHFNLGWPEDNVDVRVLQTLSSTTGGNTFIIQGVHVVDGIDVIDRACQQIAAELRLQYTLRYRSAGSATAGTRRSLRVESPQRDLSVRARSGSYGE